MIRNYSSFDTKFRAIATEEYHTHHDAVDIGDIVYGMPGHYGMMFIKMAQESGGIGPGIVIAEIKVKNTMSSIGVQDKNRKDIFELDVIEWEGFVMVMVYNSTYGGYLPMYDSCVCEDLYRNNDDTKIIGTIFDPEHKELYDKVKDKLGLEV